MKTQPKSTVVTALTELSKGTACNTILNGQFSPHDVIAHISSVASAFLTSGMPVTPEMLHAGIDYAVAKINSKDGGVIAPFKINPEDLPPTERHN